MRRFYPKANHDVQWYGDDYSDSPIDPNVLVIHTTEGASFPNYAGNYPHLTGAPNWKRKRLDWRQHQRLDRSARALQNDSGGVETNTLNAGQVELVGTCSRKTHWKWKLQGIRHIYWPKAPKWALREVAELVKFYGANFPDFVVQDAAPRGWVKYPKSYGEDAGQRMTNREWRNAYGVVGHQHVPENSHGDPGNLDVPRIIDMAKGGTAAEPSKPGRVSRADDLLAKAQRLADDKGWVRRKRIIREARLTLRKLLRK